MEQGKERRIERRAKNMILNKDIPHSKMEAVRSLMKNEGLGALEKYGAIIQLIQDCPDKPSELESHKEEKSGSATHGQTSAVATEQVSPQFSGGSLGTPAKKIDTSVEATGFIGSLYQRFKPYNLFAKRYLIHADNILKFWFKKRLVPNRRFFKIMTKIISYQEKILYIIPGIMKSIVEDPAIEDPTVYNYLRVLRKWMLDNPFVKIGYQPSSWLDTRHFESELSNYIQHYMGFALLDTELKEHIILTVENKLRQLPQLKKKKSSEDLSASDVDEKVVYDYMMTVRSFIPNPDAGQGLVDRYLNAHVGTQTLKDFLIVTAEALVFKRIATIDEIKRRFNIGPIEVNRTKWECSNEFLKKAGKDPESIRKYKLKKLKQELAPLEGIVELINLKIDGRDFLAKAFDDHWHIISKRRNEYGNYAEDSFFYYLDDCINYFSHAYVPFLDGSVCRFIDDQKKVYESSIFTAGYFENRLSRLLDLQRDLLDYRTENPNETISYDEVRNILSGKLSTMLQIKSFLNHIGAFFYDMGTELYRIYNSHREWQVSTTMKSREGCRTPLAEGTLDLAKEPVPLPFFDCRISAWEKMSPIQKTFVGKYVFSDSVREGIFKNIIAFCFQMANECDDNTLGHDIESRRNLRRQITLLKQ